MYMDFSTRMRQLRAKYEVSQAQLAQETGIGANYLSIIEVGHVTPNLRWADKIMEPFRKRGEKELTNLEE